MKQVIQLNLKVKGMRTKLDKLGFAQSLAEHVMETFNDNETITECYYKLAPIGLVKELTDIKLNLIDLSENKTVSRQIKRLEKLIETLNKTC